MYGGGPSRIFAYDAENRMTSATIASNPTTYVYDGDGRRVQKTVGTVTTTYVYDAFGNLAAEYGSQPSSACTTCFLTVDHLGSTRLVSDAAGVTKERFDYLPFGEEIPSG